VKNLMRKVLVGILAAVLLVSMVGCCFFEAKNTIAAAEAAVEQAKAKGTITNAPYETCSAVAYLGGAREVYGDCDWCKALEWANKAKSMADAALAAPPRAVSPCLSMMY
jgi:outer membrane biogenesis lipoprotein LolB